VLQTQRMPVCMGEFCKFAVSPLIEKQTQGQRNFQEAP